MRRGPKAALFVCCVLTAIAAGSAVYGCGGSRSPASPFEAAHIEVLAGTGFLADIAQNVAGSRLEIMALLPPGVDPHSFEPTPQDVRDVARSKAIIVNSPGFEPAIDDLIENVGRSDVLIIEAAAGLAGRSAHPAEGPEERGDYLPEAAVPEIDPHFWLDPLKVVTYVTNIEKGLSSLDPAGKETYSRNAQVYMRVLRELDAWIAGRVATIPASRRLLVTTHDSLGYFADRYGFQVVGAVFPTLGEEGVPSAKELAALVEKIRVAGAPAVFLEVGGAGEFTRQVARETGVKVVTDLYTESLGVHAGTYVDMMRWNVDLIVEALR